MNHHKLQLYYSKFLSVIASIPPQSNWGDLRKKQGFGMESGELVT